MKHPKHIQDIIDNPSDTDKMEIKALKNTIEVNKLKEKSMDKLRSHLI